MEAEKNKAGNMNSVLRQALERRQTEHLSSNFSYRMMERVRLEAERQRKRRVRIGWMALLTSVFSLLGFGIYFIDYLPQTDVRQDSSLLKFYVYIASLVLILLGIDSWLRKKYI